MILMIFLKALKIGKGLILRENLRYTEYRNIIYVDYIEMKDILGIELFGKRILINSNCEGTAGAMFQIYVKTHLKIDDNNSFNLLCLDDPEIIDRYEHITGKGVKISMLKCKLKILKHEFPIITQNNIYK